MKAVVYSGPAPQDMSVGEVDAPVMKPGCLLIRTAYTALNRADTLQRKGLYPPPPGASPILGLEVSGVVVDVAPDLEGQWRKGERVACLVGGGAYAELVLVEWQAVLRLPDAMSLHLAASIPEAWLTAYQLLHFVGQLQATDTVLVHAGASGVGLAAIQLIKEAGATAIATASTSKLQYTLDAGATHAVDYTKGPFLPEVMRLTEDKGVDLVLDCVGASYFEMNLEALARHGRYVLYGSMGGVKSEIDLRQIMRKMLTITGTTLRARPLAYKEALVKALWTPQRVAKFVTGAFSSQIHATLDWTQVGEAHAMMESNANTGKIVLKVDGSIE